MLPVHTKTIFKVSVPVTGDPFVVVLTPTMGISKVQAEPIADATIYRSGGVGLAEVWHGMSRVAAWVLWSL